VSPPQYHNIEYLENTNVDALRQQIITSLGWIGDKRAVPVLINILENDDYDHARCMAALALGDIGGEEEVIDALEKAYNNDNDSHVRLFASMSLEKITGKSYKIETGKNLQDTCEDMQ
jgi:HEAT repeat protein